RTRRGQWRPAFKTRKARLRRAIQAVADWCRRHRHWSVKEQSAALARKLVGHYNYFGVNGNSRSLALLVDQARKVWYAWLGRRSQRRLSWKRFNEILRRFPLPEPRIRIQLWQTSP